MWAKIIVWTAAYYPEKPKKIFVRQTSIHAFLGMYIYQILNDPLIFRTILIFPKVDRGGVFLRCQIGL